MKKTLAFALFALLILAVGCINVKTHQTIRPDGSALLKHELDMSALIEYAKNQSSETAYDAEAPEPDGSYNSGDYASLPSFGSKGLGFELQRSGFWGDPLENLTPGDDAYISFDIKNNGEEEVRAMSVQFRSDALVFTSYFYGDEEYVESIPKRASDTVSFSPTVADVPPGTYYATVIAQYDTPSKSNMTVADTFSFEVKPKPPPEAPPDPEEQYSQACVNITEEYPGLECAYEGGKFTLSKEITPDGSAYSFRKDAGLFETTYNVKITEIPEITPAEDLQGGGMAGQLESRKFRDGFASGGLVTPTTLKTVMKVEYTITMPAKIENASGGKIGDDGNSVTYDVLDLYEKKQDIEITAKEENTVVKWVVIGGTVFLVLLAAAAAAWFFMRPRT